MAETNGENKIPGAYGGVYNGSNTNYEGRYNGIYGKVEMGNNAGTYNYNEENVTSGNYIGQENNSTNFTDSTYTTNKESNSNSSYSSFSSTKYSETIKTGLEGQGTSTTNTTDSTFTNDNGSSSKSSYSSFSTIGTTNSKNMPVKVGFWSKVKSFLFKEIDLTAPVKIELTPYQQKVENEINDFLHQEITFSSFKNLFKK